VTGSGAFVGKPKSPGWWGGTILCTSPHGLAWLGIHMAVVETWCFLQGERCWKIVDRLALATEAPCKIGCHLRWLQWVLLQPAS
jgi:hypothetical protein